MKTNCGARGRIGCAALLATALLAVPIAGFAAPLPAPTSAVPVTTFPFPPAPLQPAPVHITAGPDGALWFTYGAGQLGSGGGDNAVGRMSTAGVVTTHAIPGVFDPGAITKGPDGALWFTNDFQNAIERMTPNGTVTKFTDPNILNPDGIVAGPDGALWFSDFGPTNVTVQVGDEHGWIGRITTTGVATRFDDPGISEPGGISVGPDGALWFVNGVLRDSIGRITTAGIETTFSGPDIQTVGGLAAGPDGALWFTNASDGNDWIGRITIAGVVTKYTDPNIDAPIGITAGPDGALWFTDRSFGSIGRITTAGSISFTTLVRPSAGWNDIVAGPDGALWFTRFDGFAIGRTTTALTATAPGKPLAVPGNGRAIVQWAAPLGAGASPTVGYEITPYLGDAAQTPQRFSSTATTQTVTGLANGKSYRFRIAAINANGIGAWSDISPGVRVGAPLAPTKVAATRVASGVLRVSFAAAPSNGAPITGYTVTCVPSNGYSTPAAIGKASPITVPGLIKGKTHTCTVVAKNSRGAGVMSARSAPVKA